MELPEAYRIPSFGELDARPVFGDLRLGWSPQGFAVSLRVQGKRQSPWCRASAMEESDGLALWFDTRYSGTIHRATRFCHLFVMTPQGGGPQRDQPLARLLPVARASESPREIADGVIRLRSEKRIDGYLLRALIPASALTGFAPDEQRMLGFTYAVMDRELGWQTFSLGAEYAFTVDPSLWGVLDLSDERGSGK